MNHFTHRSAAPVMGGSPTLPAPVSNVLVVLMAVAAASLFSSLETKIAGARLRPFELLLVVGTVWAVVQRGAALVRNVGPITPVLALFMGAYLIRAVSAVMVGSYFAGLVELVQAVEFAVFALIVGMICAHPRNRKTFIVVFGVCTLCIGLMALVLGAVAGEIAGLKKMDEPKYTYGVVCVLVTVHYILGTRMRWFWAAALLVCAPLVVLSGERNAWLGIGCAIAVLAFTGGAFIKRRVGGILISSTLGMVIFVGSFWSVAQVNEYAARQWTRLLEPLDYLSSGVKGLDILAAESPSNKARLLQLQNMRDIVQEKPWFGLGTGQYFPYAASVAFASDLNYITTMHGEYWQLLVENGVFSFGLYCAAWVMLLRVSAITYRKIGPGMRMDWSVALATTIYGMVANLFVGGGAVNFLLLFLPIGLCLGIWQQTRLTRGHQSPPDFPSSLPRIRHQTKFPAKRLGRV